MLKALLARRLRSKAAGSGRAGRVQSQLDSHRADEKLEGADWCRRRKSQQKVQSDIKAQPD